MPRTFNAILAVVLGLTQWTSVAIGEEKSPLQIEIEVFQPTFRVGQPIPLIVTYMNVGEQPIRLVNLTVWANPLIFQVSGERPVTILAPRYKFDVGEEGSHNLMPRESIKKIYDLWAWFAFDSLGEYQVQAMYTQFHGLPETMSNTIALQLTSALTETSFKGLSLTEIQNILQETLNLKWMKGYYHADVPQREILYIKSDNLPEGIRLKGVFDRAVFFIPEAVIQDYGIKNFLEFTQIEQAAKRITVHFRYPIEGVRGQAVFDKKDTWQLIDSSGGET